MLAALLLGILARLIGMRGVFYRLVGPAATALDDLTGTLPPYDHFIVLGPNNCQAVVDAVADRTGLRAAIVDVNNLSGSTGTLPMRSCPWCTMATPSFPPTSDFVPKIKSNHFFGYFDPVRRIFHDKIHKQIISGVN